MTDGDAESVPVMPGPRRRFSGSRSKLIGLVVLLIVVRVAILLVWHGERNQTPSGAISTKLPLAAYADLSAVNNQGEMVPEDLSSSETLEVGGTLYVFDEDTSDLHGFAWELTGPAPGILSGPTQGSNDTVAYRAIGVGTALLTWSLVAEPGGPSPQGSGSSPSSAPSPPPAARCAAGIITAPTLPTTRCTYSTITLSLKVYAKP